MSEKERYLFTASMDVDPEKEDLFNEVYDTEHVPLLSKVPGVISVQRVGSQPFQVAMGGELKDVDSSSEPRYTATYEIDSPDVLTTPEWSDAVEQGRWPPEVRPHTRNRRHILYRIMQSDD